VDDFQGATSAAAAVTPIHNKVKGGRLIISGSQSGPVSCHQVPPNAKADVIFMKVYANKAHQAAFLSHSAGAVVVCIGFPLLPRHLRQQQPFTLNINSSSCSQAPPTSFRMLLVKRLISFLTTPAGVGHKPPQQWWRFWLQGSASTVTAKTRWASWWWMSPSCLTILSCTWSSQQEWRCWQRQRQQQKIQPQQQSCTEDMVHVQCSQLKQPWKSGGFLTAR